MDFLAPVLEKGCITYPEAGTPQGGVISPLLANIFLREVLDVWFEHDVKPRLRDWAMLIRYADDVVLCFGQEEDARKVHDVLAKRFAKYGLTLHPEKTRLVKFRRPDHRAWQGDPEQGPGTFDLLGFTHYCAAAGSSAVEGVELHREPTRPDLRRRTGAPEFPVDLPITRPSDRATPYPVVYEERAQRCLVIKSV